MAGNWIRNNSPLAPDPDDPDDPQNASPIDEVEASGDEEGEEEGETLEAEVEALEPDPTAQSTYTRGPYFQSKLSLKQRRDLNTDILSGNFTVEALCRKYKLSRPTIYRYKKEMQDQIVQARKLKRISQLQDLNEQVGFLYQKAKIGIIKTQKANQHKDAVAYLGQAAGLVRLEAERRGEIGAKAAPAPTVQMLNVFPMPKAEGVPLMAAAPREIEGEKEEEEQDGGVAGEDAEGR